MFMDWKIKFVKISPNWLIELMQLYSKLNRALARTWQDASVIYIEKGQEEKTFWIPNATDSIVLFPLRVLFSNSFLVSQSFFLTDSMLECPRAQAFNLFPSITLTLVNSILILAPLNKNHLLASISIRSQTTLLSNCLLDIST